MDPAEERVSVRPLSLLLACVTAELLLELGVFIKSGKFPGTAMWHWWAEISPVPDPWAGSACWSHGAGAWGQPRRSLLVI